MSQLEKTLVTYAPYPDRISQVIIGSPCNWFCSLVKLHCTHSMWDSLTHTHTIKSNMIQKIWAITI